jgi:hypothetical protein
MTAIDLIFAAEMLATALLFVALLRRIARDHAAYRTVRERAR